MLNEKATEQKEWALSNIMKKFGQSNHEVAETSMKFKGKMLMGLKEYPRLNLKRAFWRWYLNSTGSGENLFHKTANQLVLYTNVNKTTSFYRLLGTVRSRQRKVHPRVKRMTTMLYLYSKMFFDRNKREFFEIIKLQGKTRKSFAAGKLLECAKNRKISAFKLWLQEAKKRRDEQNKKRGYYVECAKKLLIAS